MFEYPEPIDSLTLLDPNEELPVDRYEDPLDRPMDEDPRQELVEGSRDDDRVGTISSRDDIEVEPELGLVDEMFIYTELVYDLPLELDVEVLELPK